VNYIQKRTWWEPHEVLAKDDEKMGSKLGEAVIPGAYLWEAILCEKPVFVFRGENITPHVPCSIERVQAGIQVGFREKGNTFYVLSDDVFRDEERALLCIGARRRSRERLLQRLRTES